MSIDDKGMKNCFKIIRYQITNFVQDILDMLIGPLILFLIHLKKVLCYLIHSEYHKLETSSLSLEKETLVSSYFSQVDKLSSLVPSDEPLTLIYFEIFIEQKIQIPILLKHSQSPKLVENETYKSTLIDNNIPSKQPRKIYPWDIKRYKPLNFPFVLHDLPPKNFKYLPKFNGEDNISAKKHMATFEHFIDCLDI
jgi:hypothetical protein